MLHKKWIALALLTTAAISTTASASDRGINTALGAVAGALIGNTVGGQNGAVVGGVLGAVVGNSVGGHDGGRYYRQQPQAYYNAPVYYRQQPAYARPYYRDGYAERHYERVDYRPYGYGDYRR
jgi:phage tail tape-measure protein